VLVSDSVTGFGPATFTRSVGPGFVRLAKSLGAAGLKFDSDEDE